MYEIPGACDGIGAVGTYRLTCIFGYVSISMSPEDVLALPGIESTGCSGMAERGAAGYVYMLKIGLIGLVSSGLLGL